MKKYKLIKRPLRLLHTRDKNKYPYIKYKSKNISLKGTNVDEILKILNKLTKKVKRRKLEPTEVKNKKDNIKKYLSGVISSSMSATSGQVIESRLKEDTEKINELKKENDILKTAITVGNKGINENEKTLKAIEQDKKQYALEYKKLEQENKELKKYISLTRKELMKLIEYDNETNQYVLKTPKREFSGNIESIAVGIDQYMDENEAKKKQLNDQIKQLNEKQKIMELDQQQIKVQLKLAEREAKKNELEKQRLEKEKELIEKDKERLGLKNIELEQQSKRQQIIKELETNKLQNEISKINTEKNILDDDKKKLNELMSKLNNDYEQVKKDKKITEDEKNRILREQKKLEFIANGLKKTSKNIETIKMENKIPATTNFDTKYQIYEYLYNRDNPILEQIQIKELEPEQQGDGYIKKFNDGLYTSQIDKIMSPSKYYTYTIANDELDEMINYIKDNKILRGGFIMNTLNTYDKNKVGHWVAIYWDLINEYELNYYDPYGDSPKNKELIRMFKDLFDDLDIDAYVKVKVNKVKQQSVNSANCGWFSIKFLLSRFADIPFKQATNYKKISDSEKDITEIKKHYNKFGFI